MVFFVVVVCLCEFVFVFNEKMCAFVVFSLYCN